MRVKVVMGVAGLCVVLLAASCKRQVEKVPTVNREPRAAGPTTHEIADERKAKLMTNLEPLPDLGEGFVFKAPDGELWTKFSNGLMIHDLVRLDGVAPKLGQTVQIAYKGLYPAADPLKAKEFDKRSADNPLSFHLGGKEVIRGLSMGVATMKMGSTRRIYVPGNLAYGERGDPQRNIAPNQDLIFEVELLGVTGEAVDIAVPTVLPLGPALPADSPAPASMPAQTKAATRPANAER